MYMWQKSGYFCLDALNRLLKTVEVDDLSNSDKVKSTVTSLESEIWTWGILLMAISPTSMAISANSPFTGVPPKKSTTRPIWLNGLYYNLTHPINLMRVVLDWVYTSWKEALRFSIMLYLCLYIHTTEIAPSVCQINIASTSKRV